MQIKYKMSDDIIHTMQSSEIYGKPPISKTTRKRFLRHMIPLKDLLSEHGFICGFPYPTTLCLKRGDQEFAVAMKEGGPSFNGSMFSVHRLHGEETNLHVTAYHLSGVIRTLVGWGGLGPDEIPERSIEHAMNRVHIQCDNCGNQQTTNSTFKQCQLCRENTLHCAVSGFYCSKECQRFHWPVHRLLMHL